MILSGKVLYEINEDDVNVKEKTLRIGNGVKEMSDRCNVNIREEIRAQIKTIDFNELEAVDHLSGCTVHDVFPNVEVVLMPKAKTVYANMFEKCQKLKKVDMKNVERVHEAAFKGCTKLQQVLLPNVIFIGKEAFARCERLKTISLRKERKVIQYFAFSETAVETIDLGDAKVGLGAFNECGYLQSLSIDTLRDFDTRALADCYAFKKILVRDKEYAYIEKAPHIIRGKTYSLVYDDEESPFAPDEKHMICGVEEYDHDRVYLVFEYIQAIDKKSVNSGTFSRLYVLKNGKYIAVFTNGKISLVSDSVSSLVEAKD